MTTLEPLELLKSELSDDSDAFTVVNACKRLPLIAAALGPERALFELVPFLNEWLEATDNDEARVAAATSIGKMVDLIGGMDKAPALIPVLEMLSTLEETVVRRAAVDALGEIVPQLSQKDFLAHALELLKRLAEDEWWAARWSAARFLPKVFAESDEDGQRDLLNLFVQLGSDDTPMVRTEAFVVLPELLPHCEEDDVLADLLPLVALLSKDNLERMRIFSVKPALAITAMLDAEDFEGHAAPILRRLQNDIAFRVREKLAEGIPGVVSSITAPVVVPMFAELMKDEHQLVKVMCARKLRDVGVAAPDMIVSTLAPSFESMRTDESPDTRTEFASTAMSLSNLVDEASAASIFLPLVERLIEDEHSLVRHNVLEKLEVLTQKVSPQRASEVVVPALAKLAVDPKWRVRHEVVSQLVPVGRVLGVQVFEEHLLRILMTALSDHVFSIRSRAAEQIPAVLEAFGSEWTVATLLPTSLAVFSDSSNYLHRITALRMVETLIPAMDAAGVKQHLVPILNKACQDAVSNVKFTAAKIVTKTADKISEADMQELVPLLQAMTTDEDDDVAFFAAQALEVVNGS